LRRPRPDLLAVLGALAVAVAGAGCGGHSAPKTSSTAPAARFPRPTAQEERTLLAAIKTARTCIDKKGFRVSGGPIYPQESPTSPDGELIAGRAKAAAFIAFYTSASRAQRLEPVLKGNARGVSTIERRGAVALLLVGRPAPKLRAAVTDCAFS
jgi:hypothetical protein